MPRLESGDPSYKLRNMIGLISAYERRLRRMAEEASASRRMNAVYAAFFPWIVLILVAYVAVRALGPSREIEMIILLPLTALAAAGAGYAGFRIAAYGWRIDRTPPAAPWTQTANGNRLVQALRRASLNGLSSITLQTRLRSDLRLTAEDVAALFTVLGLVRMGEDDLTVEALLAQMTSSELSK